jgi:hypothetical protein
MREPSPVQRSQTLLAAASEARILAHLCIATVLIVLALPGNAQVFHRWVDDQGNIHYSDVVPPSEIDKGRTTMSPQGVAVETVAPQKTPEQIQRERELARLQAQQQRMLDQQRADDRVLLNTFQNVDDLLMTRDGNLSNIDTAIQFSKGNIRRQQDWLTELRAKAGDLERKGMPVPERLQSRITNTEKAIQEALAAIVEREQQKQEIRQKFDRDLRRLRQLKQLPEPTATETPTIVESPRLENIVECTDSASCDRLWTQAIAYVKRYATKPIESLGEDMAITEAPTQQDDIGLIVSRIWSEDRQVAKIFLDLQCRSYAPGDDRDCRNEARTRVLMGFRAALSGKQPRDLGANGSTKHPPDPVPPDASGG